MTVGQLKKALENVNEELPVCIKVKNDYVDDFTLIEVENCYESSDFNNYLDEDGDEVMDLVFVIV